MSLFHRIRTNVKADAHGVLEQLEERTLLAKQHLREAELELDRKRAQIHACEEESRRLAEEAEHLELEIAALDALGRVAAERQNVAQAAADRLLVFHHEHGELGVTRHIGARE